MNNFITLREDLGHWDIEKITNDLKWTLTSNGYDWNEWRNKRRVIKHGVAYPERGIDINLTSNMDLCKTAHDRLWKYSSRYNAEAPISDEQLTTIIPEIRGTYLESMLKFLQGKFGDIRVRLHHRSTDSSLHWHKDARVHDRYHLALWTNPGFFLVWTDNDDILSEDAGKKPMKFNTEFIPADGKFRLLRTQDVLHGVACIGTHWRLFGLESRCHLLFQPISI